MVAVGCSPVEVAVGRKNFFFAVREIKKGQSHDSPIP